MPFEGRAAARYTRELREAPRRGAVRAGGGDDRRLLRGVAAALSLLVALYCLIAAGVTLGVPTFPGAPDGPASPRLTAVRVPLLIPIICLAFLVVLGAVARSAHRRSGLPLPPPGPSASADPARRRAGDLSRKPL
jgi:hypothetical protein